MGSFLDSLEENGLAGIPVAQRSVKLLVSIRNCDEADLALRAGVDWIDVKDPTAGPLGAPTGDSAMEIYASLQRFPSRSVALGELHDLPVLGAPDLPASGPPYWVRHYPIAKIGLSEMANDENWTDKLSQLTQKLLPETQLVPVIYADSHICQAPTVAAVLEYARLSQCRHLLVDTFTKDGRGLLDFLTTSDIAELIELAQQFHCDVVLAGSIRQEDLPALLPLGASAIAVRGAVCQGGRRLDLCPTKLRQWVELFRMQTRVA
ncbi:MAG: hypothetical protein KDB22_26245 [Planctomycetales bacterium]|nr:hypothetical protein [Planctomycetales bacterium]